MVIKRVEVTRGEYSYDNAVNTIVNLNKIYKPAFIYADAGAGEIFAVLFQRHRRNKIISKEKAGRLNS